MTQSRWGWFWLLFLVRIRLHMGVSDIWWHLRMFSKHTLISLRSKNGTQSHSIFRLLWQRWNVTARTPSSIWGQTSLGNTHKQTWLTGVIKRASLVFQKNTMIMNRIGQRSAKFEKSTTPAYNVTSSKADRKTCGILWIQQRCTYKTEFQTSTLGGRHQLRFCLEGIHILKVSTTLQIHR